MAEQMEEQQALGAVEDMDDWSGSSEQDQMVEDFADGAELVDEEGNPLSTDDNPEEGNDEEVTEENTQETDEADKGQGKDASPTDEFFADGELDLDRAIDFLGIGKEQPAQPKTAVRERFEQPEPEQRQQQQPTVDEYEQLKSERLSWIQKINDRWNAGERDLQKLLNDVALEEQGLVNQLISDKKLEAQNKSLEERQRKFEEQMAARELQPKAESNFQRVANGMKLKGGAEQAQKLLLDPNYGGQYLDAMFDMASQFKPEWQNVKGQALQDAYQQFVVQFMSDPKRAEALAEFTRAKIQRELMPHIVKQARGQGRAQEQVSRKVSNKGSKRMTRQQAKPTASKGDEISDWLGGADDRIASL